MVSFEYSAFFTSIEGEKGALKSFHVLKLAICSSF